MGAKEPVQRAGARDSSVGIVRIGHTCERHACARDGHLMSPNVSPGLGWVVSGGGCACDANALGGQSGGGLRSSVLGLASWRAFESFGLPPRWG